MYALTFSFLASIFSAASALFFRKNMQHLNSDSHASGYLSFFYLTSFILTFLFYPEIWETNINFIILLIGISVGTLSSILMILTSRALKYGPSGLTFAFQNASAVFPGLILFLFFGSNFGFSYSYLQLLGIIFVLLGLFLGAKKEAENQQKASFKWLKYALGCFFVQIFALTFIQARCILFDCVQLRDIFPDLIPTQSDDIWFMPGQFGAAFVIQAFIFLREQKKLQTAEMSYGSLGGLANFASTALLLLATKFALPFEKGILFPCFAVSALILCNLWANKLYDEKFNLKTNMLCSLGIFMAVGA